MEDGGFDDGAAIVDDEYLLQQQHPAQPTF